MGQQRIMVQRQEQIALPRATSGAGRQRGDPAIIVVDRSHRSPARSQCRHDRCQGPGTVVFTAATGTDRARVPNVWPTSAQLRRPWPATRTISAATRFRMDVLIGGSLPPSRLIAPIRFPCRRSTARPPDIGPPAADTWNSMRRRRRAVDRQRWACRSTENGLIAFTHIATSSSMCSKPPAHHR